MHTRSRMAALAVLTALALSAVSATAVLAHEERQVAGYDMEVGFINEPVFVGDKSGLEFSVMKDGQPVEGLETTLKAEVKVGDQHMDLPITAREDDPGWYESVFIPTLAGPYTFHISGTIEGQAIDESFTSSPTGFNEVQDTAAGQFPIQFPAMADLAAQAKQGADANAELPLALGLGGAGAILGLLALGVSLAGRRRA